MPELESIVEVNGVPTWTATRGAGPAVVLLHGGPGICDYLAPVAEMLEDKRTVHRYEQRGCGRTPWRDPMTIDALIADLDGLRAAWGQPTWDVVGHSWGANLGLLYALRHPDRVSALLYLSGTGLTNKWKPEHNANARARLTDDERRRAAVASARRPGDAALEREAMELLVTADFADPARLATVPRPLFAYPTQRGVNARINAEWETTIADASLADRVRALRVRTLVVHGAADPRPAWPARAVAELVPGARFVLLDDVGHEPFWERPEALRRVLREFLS